MKGGVEVNIGDRIKQRRKEIGLSADVVADALGVDRSTVYRYESQDIDKMPIHIIGPLAKILNVSPAYLLGWSEEPGADIVKGHIKRVPLLGEIAAGEPLLACEERQTYIEVEDSSKVDFCLRVKGDSMVDVRIYDGDLVFVHKQSDVDNGDIAVVLIDGEATLKRFYRDKDGIILKPENKKYQPRYFSASDCKDIRILGKAVFFQGKL